MKTVYIGLGSNLSGSMGDPQKQMQTALEKISDHPEIHQLNTSSFYRTSPVGPQDQPDFINAVAQAKTSLTPLALLDYLQQIENEHGRERKEYWGARTLDLDILIFGQQSIHNTRLIIPHPRIEERAFVLVPLLEVKPNFSSASGKSITDLLAKCSDQGIVKL
ncbi:MAG: 2-amino-4-hydroxy-6-hydroxymethyldihydropteridine diphosphokinase [SAR92 clade bacterium]|uniref:2-amino-4-hydroxy-6-hydroxymethyldihydropteridine pyrophosphokinase n=1 Tax=SAR92 clade bacterium TaxID=2315479 RepID=A0A520MIN3_9GAMM|nr:MAG: 2-amino-4-hydroxy-6-hydroxymethyldihydropteridine diphosphokinase [SAR92 clade bacterium]